MGNAISDQKPQSGLIRVPVNYPNYPTPGKLQLLLNTNAKSLYHKYSPYTDYDNGFVGRFLDFGPKQPLLWVYPQENNGLAGIRTWETRMYPLGSAGRDVIRVSKFLGTGKGVLFLGKQFLLQAHQAFNETRIYNPTSPIVAAGSALTLGLVRPQRNFDTSAGLLGIAKTLIGDTIPNLLGGDADVGIPNKTAGAGALGRENLRTGGKGLIRGETAAMGYAAFTKKWSPVQKKFSWGELGKTLIRTLIPSAFSPGQPKGTVHRGDEGSYGIMLQAGDIKFQSTGVQGEPIEFGQRWVAGGKLIRKTGEYPHYARRLFAAPTPGTYWWMPNSQVQSSPSIPGVGPVGYAIEESRKETAPGYRYGDTMGAAKDPEFKSSDVMVQHEMYSRNGHQYDYPTKKTDKASVEKYNNELQKVIDSIQKSGVYTVASKTNSSVIPNANRSLDGYNQLLSRTNGQDHVQRLSPLNYPNGVMSDYKDTSMLVVDNSLTNRPHEQSKKLPGAGNFDAINTLRILPGEQSDEPRAIRFTKLSGWTKWEPYRDDQIAFYFYDVVNDKYVPFRCTVKNVSEAASADWGDLSFIGRADRLYSYNGFTRQLSFQFDVVIGSIMELAPTWKRLNYLASLVKPARYTKSAAMQINGNTMPFNRFMVPPMVEVTIGDLYKKQPILIQSVTVSIPDDAIWETQNEFNTNNKEWSHMVDYIKAKALNEREFGQFPHEANVSLNCILLEKERAIVGAANFGHAPHTPDYRPNEWLGETPPYMHQALVEYQWDSSDPVQSPIQQQTTIPPAPQPTPLQSPAPVEPQTTPKKPESPSYKQGYGLGGQFWGGNKF